MDTAYDLAEEKQDLEIRIEALEELIEFCENHSFNKSKKQKYKNALISLLEDTDNQLRICNERLKFIQLER